MNSKISRTLSALKGMQCVNLIKWNLNENSDCETKPMPWQTTTLESAMFRVILADRKLRGLPIIYSHNRCFNLTAKETRSGGRCTRVITKSRTARCLYPSSQTMMETMMTTTIIKIEATDRGAQVVRGVQVGQVEIRVEIRAEMAIQITETVNRLIIEGLDIEIHLQTY